MIKTKSSLIKETENILTALEGYRIAQKKAYRSLEKILETYGIEVDRKELKQGNFDEVRKKVNEHEGR